MRIGTYELESPLINAGGVVKSVEDVRRMAATGVGAVLAGSFTLEPRIGNSPNGEVVYHHDSESGTTFNALGMPNPGLVNVATQLPEMIDIAHEHGKPFILNLAPVSQTPVDEIAQMEIILARAGVQGLDAIELNASCPNVVTTDGDRHAILSHNPDLMAEVLDRLDYVGFYVPYSSLFVRVSPFLNRASATLLAEEVDTGGINAVSAFNTFPGGNPTNERGKSILQVPGGVGGQSGAAMSIEAEEQTKWLIEARDAIGGHFDVIGSNGVTDAASMKRRLDLGASAVSASTLFYQSANWGKAVDKLLSAYSKL